MAALLAACSGDSPAGSASRALQSGPPYWNGGVGAGVPFEPVAWPSEPAPSACGATCGDWKPYTRFQNSLNDARTQDPSNGGTSPQAYVNVASSCIDRTLPSVYYALRQHPTDASRDVILFRWRVAQPAHTYATGPSAGAFGSSDPWSSALWTVFFDVDGSGYRSLAAHINGSSGSPSAPVDTLAGVYGRVPTQSIDYVDDPANIKLLGMSSTAFVDDGTGALLNFQNALTPSPVWPNGSAETVWDYGTTRARLVTERPCTEYFIDYQIPVALLDATAHGGPKVTRSSPLSMLFCTANSLNNPLQKDCALNRKWLATTTLPAPFGDYISFDQAQPYAQPIIAEVTASAPRSCADTYALTAKIQDALWVDPSGTVRASVQAASFWSYADTNADRIANDGSTWTWAVDATLAPGKLNEWRATWDTRTLPRGSYLIGVQALDDDTRVDDGMTPSGKDHRTFSYVTSDAAGRVYVDGSWRIDTADFPVHAPALAPPGGEDWYGNPLVTGIQVAGTGIDVAINACGIAPTLTLTASPSQLATGGTVGFALTLGNAGNTSPLAVTTLTAELPAGFTYVPGSTAGAFGSADPAVSGTTLTWTLAPGVTVGANGSGTLTFSATASLVAGAYNAHGTATTGLGAVTSDPVALTLDAARLALTMTADPSLISPDGVTVVTYTLAYRNDSAVPVSGAALSVPLAGGVTFAGCTGGTACASGGGVVTWTVGTLAPGSTGTATLRITVPPSFTSTSVTHTATLRANAPDGTELTRTAASTVAVEQPTPVLRATMSASVVRVAPDGSVTWTISYANQGDGTASGALLVDTLPAGFTFTGCTVTGSTHFTTCANVSGVVTFSGAAGAGVSVPPGASGSVTLTATAASAPFTYPNPAVNRATLSATGTASVQAQASVGITGQYCDYVYYFRRGADNLLPTVRPASLTAPTATATYSTAVPNIASNAYGPTSTYADQIVFLQDAAFSAPADLSGLVATIDFNLGAAQGGANTRVILENATTGVALATSADINITNGQKWYAYNVTMPAGSTLAAGQKLRWVFQFNKTGRDITFYYDSTTHRSRSSFCQAAAPAQLTVSNSVDKAFIAGPVEKLTYTLSYANVGGTTASSVVLTDTLPAGMTACEYSTTGALWTACTTATAHSFALGSLAAGATGVVYVRGDSPASPTAGAPLTNTASLSSSTTAAVTATATTSVESAGSGGSPSLLLTASADKGTVGPGETVTYTVRVANVGTAPATNVSVSDVVPAASWYRYVAGSIAGGTARSVSGDTLGWTIATLPVGGVATLTFQLATEANGLPAGLTARDTFAAASDATFCTGGTLPAGCTSNTVTVMVDGAARLTLASAVSPATPVSPGALLEYTLTVGSTGSATASSVVLRSALPAFTRFEAVTSGSGTYDAANQRVVFDLGALAGDETAVRTFTLRVDREVPAGTTTLTSVSTVSAANAQQRSATVESQVSAEPVLRLQAEGPASLPGPAARLVGAVTNATTVEVDRATLLEVGGAVQIDGSIATVVGIRGTVVTLDTPINAGSGAAVWRGAAYALTFENTGDAAAESVVLTAALPAGWKFVGAAPAPSSAPAVGATGNVSWTAGTVGVGAAGSVRLVAIPTQTGTLDASVADTRACTTPLVAGCADTVTTVVGGLIARKRTTTPVLSIWPAGAVASYVVTLENTLDTPVAGVQVTELLPSGFTYRAGTATPAPTTVTDGQPTWSGLSVPAQDSLELVFQVDVAATVGNGSYDNGLAVTAPAGVGVTAFDPTATTDEDVTAVGAGRFVSAGQVFRDVAPRGTHDASDEGLADVVVAYDDGSGLPPYEVPTRSDGAFALILADGDWSVNVPAPRNLAALSGLVLHGAYTPTVVLDETTPTAAALKFGYVDEASSRHDVDTVVVGNGSISPESAEVLDGATASFTVTPAVGWSVESVTGCGGALAGSTYTSAAVSADCTVTATFVRNQYAVSTSVTGQGSVSPGSATVAHGDAATFTFTPAAGYHLESVSGCAGTLVDATYTTGSITGACTVAGVFALNEYAVSTEVVGDGSISPTSATVVHGAEASFTLVAAEGYRLDGVSGCAGLLIGDTYTTAPASADCTVTATFVRRQYTVSTSSSGGGTLSPASALVAHGDGTAFTVTADVGHHLVEVTGCGGTLAGTTFTTGAVVANCTVTATFAVDEYLVSTAVVGSGTLSPASETVRYGETATFTATPAAGYSLQSVAGCGGTLSGNTFTTAAVTGGCTVTATFMQNEHVVSTSVVGGGSLSPTSATLLHGETATFTATPATGYVLQSVTGCGGSLAGDTFTTAAVTADCTVTATFTQIQYVVSTEVVGGGALSATSATVGHGDTATFTATAAVGYSLQSVTGCGGSLAGNVFTTAAVTADCTVTATFSLNQYVVSTEVVGSGSLSATSATVAHGDTATFTATPAAGYSLQSVTGCGGTLVANTFTTAAVTADCTVTVTFSLNQYLVSTAVVGSGALSATSATVAHGDTATFTATPAAGYSLQSVTGCGGSLSGNTFTTAAVVADCTVTATFTQNTYVVSTSVVGSGSLSPTSATVLHGETATFTATPATGYSLESVSGCGGSLSGVTFTTAAVTAPCTVTATFTRNDYLVSTSVVGSGSLSPASATVLHGETATFTATPATGYSLESVSGCGGSLGGDTFTTAAVTANCTVIATFTQNAYVVSTSVVGSGSLSPTSATVLHGETATFAATPATGYSLESVSGCSGSLSGGTFTTAAVTAPCTVTATFTRNDYLVSTSVVGSGSLSPTSATVLHGETATFTATPATGYSLESVSGCGGTLTGSTFTTAAVTADCTVTATFTRNQYLVSTSFVGSGSLSPTSATVLHGEVATFTATPATGYSLESVTGCGGTLSGSTFTTAAVTADCTVTATFTLNTYLVSTSVTGSGSLAPSARSVNHGETATFTATPATGYALAGVTGCGGTLLGDSFTTAAVTADCTVSAVFVLKQYPVTLEVVGTGSVEQLGMTATGSGVLNATTTLVDHGATASFVATPGVGYSLASFTGCGGGLTGNTFTTGAVTASCTVTATFVLNQYVVSTAVVGSGALSPTTRTVNHGETASFTATPATGYSLQGVTGCGGTLTGNTFTTGAVTAHCTVTATFVLNAYVVSTAVVGSGALSPASRTVNHGETASFTATPATGHSLQSVTGCNGTLSGDTYTTAAVTADCTVTATFVVDRHTVSTSVTGSGTLSPTSVTVDHGTSTAFTVTPGSAHALKSITGCGGTLSGNTYSTAAVTADCTVAAVFTRPPHSLRMTVIDPVLNACGVATVKLELIDANGDPVAPDAAAPVSVTLAAAAATGTPQLVDTQLEDVVRSGAAALTGKLPASGEATLGVTLDAADRLDLTWSSQDLPTAGSATPGQISFRVGPVDPVKSTVVASGTQLFAGHGSIGVVVIPRDACGIQLGAGQTTELTATFGGLTPSQDENDGRYTTDFSASVCPVDPARIVATVNGVVLVQQPEVTVACAGLDEESPVTVLPRTQPLQACASKGEFARIQVIPVDTQGKPLPPGQAVTLVESPPHVVSGGVETSFDEVSGATTYTVLVGSNRCSRTGPRAVELRVANLPLATRPVLDFACPSIPEGGVTYAAEPPVVLADGETPSRIRASVVDACGNPGFARALTLRPDATFDVALSTTAVTTEDAYGAATDGTVLFEVRSATPGVTGVSSDIDGAWHASAADLVTFVDPYEGYHLAGGGLGCTSTGGTGLLPWIAALVLATLLRRRGALPRRASHARTVPPVALFAVLLLTSAAAQAQSPTAFELQPMRPSLDPTSGSFTSLRAGTPGHANWAAHLLLDFAKDPLVLYDAQDERVASAISRQAILHLLATVGVHDFLEFGADLPVFVHQAGEVLPFNAPPISHGAGLGDLRLLSKARFLKTELGGVALEAAAALDVFVPIGDASGMRGGDFRIGPWLFADATFANGARVGLNAGYQYRTPREFAGLRIADSFGWTVHGELPVHTAVALRAELLGRLGDAGNTQLYAPTEALVGAKLRAPWAELVAGVGMGFGRSHGTPEWRALLSVQPRLPRRAPATTAPIADPKPVVIAQAPPPPPKEEPKPEPVPVAPAPVPAPVAIAAVQPEPPAPAPAPAPAKPAVQVDRAKRRLELSDVVHFETASARIAQRSFALLDEVASVLAAHPEIKVLVIEGHTDNRGGRGYNQQLSQARADSLRRYLIAKEIDAGRLQAKGFGLDRPVATNATPEGRALNRRVEFRIETVIWEENAP